MKGWLYPQKEWREIGEIRWHVTWEIVKPSALARVAADPTDEIDIDLDIQSLGKSFKAEAEARMFAQKTVNTGDTAFGSVCVQKEIIDWFVKEDHVAEWTDAGEPEYVEAEDAA